MAHWTFLTNHGLVLAYIGRRPESTGLEIAQAVGITERAARKILADLQTDGYVEWETVGRRNHYRVNAHLPLRHLGERGLTVGELLDLLWSDGNEATVTLSEPTSARRPVGRPPNGGAGSTGTGR